jgi:hypothetical protein
MAKNVPFHANPLVRSGWYGMLVTMLAFLLSITVTIQVFPAEDIQHSLTEAAYHTGDDSGHLPGTPDTKDNCGVSIHCHSTAAIIPASFSIGTVAGDERASSLIKDGAFRVVSIPVPPPRLA